MMKSLNQRIDEYTMHLQRGELQTAYKAILEFIGKLRADFSKKHPHYDIGGVYQGYMDMTYIPLSTNLLKDKGLKIAIVYLHEKKAFEVWLSARNRDIAKNFASVLNSNILRDVAVFHDEKNQDALIESTLTSAPNFEDQALLMDIIEQGVEQFIGTISALDLGKSLMNPRNPEKILPIQ